MKNNPATLPVIALAALATLFASVTPAAHARQLPSPLPKDEADRVKWMYGNYKFVRKEAQLGFARYRTASAIKKADRARLAAGKVYTDTKKNPDGPQKTRAALQRAAKDLKVAIERLGALRGKAENAKKVYANAEKEWIALGPKLKLADPRSHGKIDHYRKNRVGPVLRDLDKSLATLSAQLKAVVKQLRDIAAKAKVNDFTLTKLLNDIDRWIDSGKHGGATFTNLLNALERWSKIQPSSTSRNQARDQGKKKNLPTMGDRPKNPPDPTPTKLPPPEISP